MKYVSRNGRNNDRLVAQHLPETELVACPHATRKQIEVVATITIETSTWCITKRNKGGFENK